MSIELKDSNTSPIRARTHVGRVAGVCDEWCRRWRFYDRLLPTAFLFGVLCFLIFFLTIAPPLNFPGATLVKIDKDEPVASVARKLKDKHIIHSEYMFKLVTKLYGSKTLVMSGEYFFPSAQNVLTIGRRLARGDFELVPVKVTIPEGVSTFQMADVLAKKIPDFDKQAFLEDSQSKEGYLFPDTYFFLPGQDPIAIISTLESNFKRHITEPEVEQQIAMFDKPLADIITMASLLEKEANETEGRRMIAGILWHRIEIGMPLQVDAVFPYILGKNTFELSRADLKTNSPYNTYINKGLPPGPITNPGMDSILAAANPVKSNYIFYLSDMHGNFHYSVTYAEQLANQRKYLK